MVSEAQVRFFKKLLEEKDFGDQNPEVLLTAFEELPNVKSGSAWIDKAMTLPKRDETDEPTVAPTF